MIEVKENKIYTQWFSSRTKKEQAQIKSRIELIENKEYFGDVSNLGDELAELRWKKWTANLLLSYWV